MGTAADALRPAATSGSPAEREIARRLVSFRGGSDQPLTAQEQDWIDRRNRYLVLRGWLSYPLTERVTLEMLMILTKEPMWREVLMPALEQRDRAQAIRVLHQLWHDAREVRRHELGCR